MHRRGACDGDDVVVALCNKRRRRRSAVESIFFVCEEVCGQDVCVGAIRYSGKWCVLCARARGAISSGAKSGDGCARACNMEEYVCMRNILCMRVNYT